MKKRKKSKKSRTRRWLFLFTILLLVTLMAGCTAIISAGNALIDKGKVKEQVEGSVLYDKDGKEMAKLYVENREYVEFKEIPPLLVKAFVNTEDERFFTHKGVDLISIGRALYKDIRAGAAVEGASTITQQLAGNVYLDRREMSLLRKTKEALIAMNLERNYSKEEILEFYLNEIYLGGGAYGIQAASKLYFGKDVKELNLAEIATLAALPKAPNNYSPINNYEKSVERRKVVLKLMEKNGSITAEQREEASNAELQIVGNQNKANQAYRSFIDYVLKEAEEKYGISESELYRGGYHIYTEMDTQAQQAMANAFNDPNLFPSSQSADPVQGSMVITDPHTGGIAAMMGGRDYVAKGMNRALAKRSPGSTFKPIAVYAPALENGWEPFSLLKDEKMTFPGNYSPSNWYGDGYLGKVTMIYALEQSKNVPAVWLLNEIGIDTSFRYLDRFGIPYDKQADRKLGIALGGMTYGVSPLDMAQAYGAFANRGVMMEAHAIRKIEVDGETVVEAKPAASTVVSEQTAYYMTGMLRSVVENGIGKRAAMNRPVAGKTGTTQEPGTNGNRDAWFVGYTPEYVGAVWMGYDQSNSTTNYLREGSGFPANFFRVVMSEALQGRPIQDFAKPKGVQELEPPVVMQPIQDLSAEKVEDVVQLHWTGTPDEKIHYQVYRYFEDPEQKEMIGETDYQEWVDLDVPTDRIVHYYVIQIDSVTGKESERSNIVELVPEQEISDEEEDLLTPPLNDEEPDLDSPIPEDGEVDQPDLNVPEENSQNNIENGEQSQRDQLLDQGDPSEQGTEPAPNKRDKGRNQNE